jgi:hypothetical protein
MALFLTGQVFSQTVYVDADATGNNDGTSWENAFTNLTQAIDSAQSGDEVWVAAGIYYPTSQPNYDIGSTNPRFNHFTLKNGVKLMGGFAGDETSIHQRDLEANKTVLSGDIDQNDDIEGEGYVSDYTKVNGENSLKLFYFPKGSTIDTTAVLDGFVLTGAVADNDVSPYNSGAAFRCQDASPKVVNCDFYGNYAKDWAGAIYLYNSSMIIDNCTFEGNKAGDHGGALYYSKSEVTLKNCRFINNEGNAGGAISAYHNESVSVIENCHFENNVALDNAGAMTTGWSPNVFKNCSFINNQALYGGALVLYTESSSEIINSVFEGNHATSGSGGALSAAHSSNVNIYNGAFRGNEAHINGGAIITSDNADLTAYNSLFTGNVGGKTTETTSSGSAVYASSAKVTLINSTVASNYSYDDTYGAAVNNKDADLIIKNSIIWENHGPYQIRNSNGIEEVTNSDVQGGYEGTGNMDVIPLFLDPINTSSTPSTGGNYRLWGNSPVNNKGINTAVPSDIHDIDKDGDTDEPISYDLGEKERVFAGVVDMGCYEQQFESVSGNQLSIWSDDTYGQYVDMGENLTLDGTDFTIELWLKPHTDAMNGSHHNICGNDDNWDVNGAAGRSPMLFIFQYDRIHYGYGDGTSWYEDDTEKALKVGQWNHIAITFDDATNTMKAYANGKLLDSLTGGEVSGTPLRYLNTDRELRAYLDEFRVWKEERTQVELIENMNTTLNGNEDNLALYYSFDQVTSGEIEDQAGLNNGTMINNPGIFNSDAILTPVLKPVENVGIDNFKISWHPVPNAKEYYIDVASDPDFNNMVKYDIPTNGKTNYTIKGLSKGTVYYYKVKAQTHNDDWGSQYGHTATKMTPPGNALALDGNTYIEATDVTKYEFEGTTIETWVKIDADQLNTKWALWACNPADFLNNYVLFYNENSDQNFSISQYDYDAGSWAGTTFNGTSITADTWYHIAVVIDKDNNKGKFYLDGNELGTFTPLAHPYPYGSYFTIGQEFDESGGTPVASDHIKGSMDEFRVWSKTLSQSEIQNNMNTTLTGNEEGLVTYYNFDLQTGKKVIDNANIFDGEVIGTADWIASEAGLQNFTVEDTVQTQEGFTLQWIPVAGASDYSVDVATDSDFENIALQAASTSGDTTYKATGLAGGTKYYFRVTSDQGDTSMVNYTTTLMEVPGNALVFDGKDDYVDASQIAELGSKTNATMECWVYMDPTETFGRFISINTADGGNKYLLSYQGKTGYTVYNQKAGTQMASNIHTKGSWVHLAVTFNYSTAKFYLNGNLISEVTGGDSPAIYPGNLISFGQEFDGDNASDFLKGAMDEVRFWDKTLTQSEIKANMHKKLSGNEEGLFAYYDFDQIEGQFVYDKVNGLDGTIIGDPQWDISDAIITPLVTSVDEITPSSTTLIWNAIDGAGDYKMEVATDADFQNIVQDISTTSNDTSYQITGLTPGTDYYVRIASQTSRWSAWSATKKISTLLIPPGNALAFDGVDGEVNVGYVMDSDWNNITLEAWAKIAPDQTANYPRIIGNYDPDGGFGMNLWKGTRQVYFEFRDANDNSWDTIMAPSSIADNMWHHIACTYDGTDMKLYLDGELVSLRNNPGAVIKKQAIKTGIGNQNGNAPLNGTLDEIRIWNTARTQEELREYAHKTLSGSESGLVSYFNLDKAEGNTFKDGAGNHDGTMTGGVSWAESKALITPFTTGAADIVNNGFTATWDSIPNASKYYLRVATDPLLTSPVEGWESVDVGSDTSYSVSGLQENTLYYYGAMSETDRLSAWSSASKPVQTQGGTTGELAANLSGTGDYIDLSEHIVRFAGKNSGAITGWFKASEAGTILEMTGATTGDNVQLIVGDFYESYENESLWFICSTDGDYDPSFGVREGHNKYLDNKWHHFALIMGDGNNRFVIDGEEKESYFHKGSAQAQEFTDITGPANFTIGQDMSVLVDELAFYKNPITNKEVRERAHRKLTGDEVGLVAYYNFNNSSAYDASGMGRNGTETGSVSYVGANLLPTPFLEKPLPGVTVADLSWTAIDSATQYRIDVATDPNFQNKVVSNEITTETSYHVEGLDKNSKYYYRVKAKADTAWSEFSGKDEFHTLPGKSLKLDGVDDYLNADGISNYSADEATIECWVKAEYHADTTKMGIWAHNRKSDGINQYVLMYRAFQQTLEVATMNESGGFTGYVTDDVDLTGSWHHVAVSIIKDGVSTVYINGKNVMEFTHHLQPIVDGFQFSIGQEWDHQPTVHASDFFKGEIDEFRVWNKALTEEEVRANMNVSEPEGADEHYIAHYTFDEMHFSASNDTIFKDLAKQNDATLVNGPETVNSEGVINPITLEPTDATPGSFVLNLNDIASAKSYELEIAYDETFVPPLAMQKKIGKTSSYKAEGLCPGVKYYYRVRAIYDENTISAWSDPDTVWTVNQDATIDNLTATQGDYSGELKLSWESQNEYLITEFEIKRRLAGEGEFEKLATVENEHGVYNFTDTTALPGTYYEYTVQGLSYCYDNDTEIDTTNVGFRLPTLAASKDDGRIRLDWEYADNFAQNVEIVRKDVETGIEQVFQEVADSTHYCDETMDLCVAYQYKMISKTDNFGDVTTKPVVYTLEEDIFDAIDTLDASKGYKDDKITLNWESHKQSIIDEYQISRRKYTSGNDWEVVKIIDKGTTQVWIDEDANPGEYYEYNITGIGSCGENAIFTDSVKSVGFRQPEGILNGQVTYEGGNPVRNVRITVDYDDSDRTYGSSLELDGTDKLEIKPVEEFTFENGMTAEMWIKPSDIHTASTLFSNSGVSIETDGSGKLVVQSGSATTEYDLASDASDVWESGWNYVAFSADAATLKLFVNGQLVNEASAATNLVLDSVNVIGDNYVGFMDEFRLWNTMRSDSLINRYHSIVLPREEEGLISALRFDENLGEYAFDHTRTDGEPNKNHARIYGAEWSKNIPSTAKLALAAKTEPTGNYQVNGIWFKGSGETFSATPSFGVHEFDPATRSLLISENSLIYNNQDFTDISAFMITGNVKYHGANFPVEGVMLSVDGQLCVDAEGAPIKTDAEGNFEIEVPIGEHFISVSKMGHTFSEGYFPPKDANGEVTYHTFNDNISGIQFVDSTYKTVAGRIVGGTVEGDKKIGFGKSKNNLGVCSFTVEAVKGFPIDGTNKQITVETDPQTGEYEVKLYPEQYSFVTSGLKNIGNSEYEFSSIEDLALLDLTSAPVLTEETDSATIMEVSGSDTTYRDTVYTYGYHHKRNWVYRSVPNIEVVNAYGEQFISDSIYYAQDENQDTVAMSLVDGAGNHTFGYPVFTKGKTYNTTIKVFEEYVNADNGDVDRVPVNDGTVTVINGVSNYPAPQDFEISEGQVEYTFYGGFPNPTVDNLNPELSYTKTFEVHAATGDGGSMQSQWPENDPYRAYVFGGIPTGNNFVTEGPDLVDFILRDPPGSNSRAFFEEGFTISKTTSNSFSNSQASSMGVNVDLGWKVTTFVGFGAGVIMENEQIANVETGVTYESSYESSHTRTETTTYTKSYSTSDDPLYVGEQGDLFFGHSTNISYGVSNFIEPVPSGTGENEVGAEVNGFKIGLKKAINFGLTYNTDFIYTQHHIEKNLIPDLEEMRDYHLNLGKQDSADFYQEQLDHWKKVLGQNEYQKYVAMNMPHPEDKNISFDAGAVYEESMTSEITETHSSSFEFSIDQSVASEIGFSVGGVGTTWSMSHETSSTQSSSTEESETQTTTVGFKLADKDQGDYFSVDVLKDFYGNGPIFSTKGGQSACPYEGGSTVEYADYYTEGTFGGFANDLDLNFPTMRIEVPKIAAENAIVSGVPDNEPAVFTLKLSNLSEVDADNWFILKVDPASNPYGAKLKMDGASIVNGVAVMVPGGTTLTKTLEFEKGRADINDYENIKLILHSQCQFDPTDDQEDISDTLSISANFIPTCSDVAITSPADNWLVNVANRDTLPVQIGQYNLQLNTLEKIAFQYRPASASSWTTQAMFFHDTTEYANYSGEKYKINGEDQITYMWDMRSLQDRDYQIRAVSICTDGSLTETEPLTGTLDGVRPQLFGAPSPADGILDPNDEIMISFNEPIEEGLVSTYNIDVEGVLNGSELNHGTSLKFDGAAAYAETPAGINLADNSYTIEFWANKPAGATGTVISQGMNESQNLDIRFTSTDIEVVINGNVYSAANAFDDGQWHHWAVAYNNSTDMLSVYGDDQILLETTAEATEASGDFNMGRSTGATADYFTGKMHDVRIWKRTLSFTDIIEMMNIQLSGNELGIFANWPMNEGEGNVVEEIVHSRHATKNAEWIVEPASSAYAFNGTDQALIANTGSIPVIDEMDMTLELWFKGSAQATESYLFSNGNPAIDGYLPEKTMGVKVQTDGRIAIENNGTSLVSTQNYMDDQWHHMAFVINRRAYATLYIDGEKVNSIPAPEMGSLESPFAYIGGLGYIDNTQTQQISSHFNGNIDEVRIWKTARKQKHIELYKNTRLAGDEAGLIAYFPFETYEEQMGTLVSASTLEDQSIDPNSPININHCGTLTLVGTESVSDISPNIKRERSKQAVNFDYVINNDQMIITPTDPLSMIEKCILEITVKNIEDKNGNVLASPATWTAYINKNQVVWEQDYYDFEKEVGQSLSFEAVIKNTSGVVQPFTLSNMPSWLNVSPVSGNISPDDQVTVTFTVADGLNIGDYTEDIFLESSSGYNERLTLDLRVFKPAPDWNVDETQFSSSMNIISQVRVRDIFSTDQYDMIAAFAGDECRGVAKMEYRENYDDYFAFLVVYGNKQGTALEYKFWDASEGKIYTDVTPEFDFEPNGMHGAMSEPTIFDVGLLENNSIALIDGWKWMSFNLDMTDNGIDKVLSSLQPQDGDVIKHDDKFAAYDSNSDSWIGSLTQVKIGKLYRMKYSASDNLKYEGKAVDADSYPIKLGYGWNRIGYISSQNRTVAEALSGFEPAVNDVIKGQYQFAMYDGYDWIGSLEYMEPGKGYMYQSQSNDSVEFIYPAVSTLKKQAPQVAVSGNIKLRAGDTFASDYEYSHSLVVKVDAQVIEGDQVKAYIDGELMGETEIFTDYPYSEYAFITVFGDQNHLQKDIAFELNSNGSVTDLSGKVAFRGNDVSGTIEQPILLSTDSETGLDMPEGQDNQVDVYPNPFNDQLTLTLYLAEKQTIRCTIYDMLGKPIISEFKEQYPAGWNHVSLDEKVNELKDGIYFLKVQSGSIDQIIKIIKE